MSYNLAVGSTGEHEGMKTVPFKWHVKSRHGDLFQAAKVTHFPAVIIFGEKMARKRAGLFTPFLTGA